MLYSFFIIGFYFIKLSHSYHFIKDQQVQYTSSRSNGRNRDSRENIYEEPVPFRYLSRTPEAISDAQDDRRGHLTRNIYQPTIHTRNSPKSSSRTLLSKPTLKKQPLVLQYLREVNPTTQTLFQDQNSREYEDYVLNADQLQRPTLRDEDRYRNEQDQNDAYRTLPKKNTNTLDRERAFDQNKVRNNPPRKSKTTILEPIAKEDEELTGYSKTIYPNRFPYQEANVNPDQQWLNNQLLIPIRLSNVGYMPLSRAIYRNEEEEPLEQGVKLRNSAVYNPKVDERTPNQFQYQLPGQTIQQFNEESKYENRRKYKESIEDEQLDRNVGLRSGFSKNGQRTLQKLREQESPEGFRFELLETDQNIRQGSTFLKNYQRIPQQPVSPGVIQQYRVESKNEDRRKVNNKENVEDKELDQNVGLGSGFLENGQRTLQNLREQESPEGFRTHQLGSDQNTRLGSRFLKNDQRILQRHESSGAIQQYHVESKNENRRKYNNKENIEDRELGQNVGLGSGFLKNDQRILQNLREHESPEGTHQFGSDQNTRLGSRFLKNDQKLLQEHESPGGIQQYHVVSKNEDRTKFNKEIIKDEELNRNIRLRSGFSKNDQRTLQNWREQDSPEGFRSEQLQLDKNIGLGSRLLKNDQRILQEHESPGAIQQYHVESRIKNENRRKYNNKENIEDEELLIQNVRQRSGFPKNGQRTLQKLREQESPEGFRSEQLGSDQNIRLGSRLLKSDQKTLQRFREQESPEEFRSEQVKGSLRTSTYNVRGIPVFPRYNERPVPEDPARLLRKGSTKVPVENQVRPALNIDERYPNGNQFQYQLPEQPIQQFNVESQYGNKIKYKAQIEDEELHQNVRLGSGHSKNAQRILPRYDERQVPSHIVHVQENPVGLLQKGSGQVQVEQKLRPNLQISSQNEAQQSPESRIDVSRFIPVILLSAGHQVPVQPALNHPGIAPVDGTYPKVVYMMHTDHLLYRPV